MFNVVTKRLIENISVDVLYNYITLKKLKDLMLKERCK